MKKFLLLLLSVILMSCGGDSGSSGSNTPVPDAPSLVTIIGGDGQVVLGWAAATGATSYNVYYGTAPGVTTSNTKKAGATSGNAITGLTNGATYYFVVTAVNAGGESTLSSEVSATPQIQVPDKPTGVAIIGDDSQVILGWVAVTGATSYNVYYGTAPGVTIADAKITGVTTGDTITDLTNGVTYYFVVTAVNAGGESLTSLEVNATPNIPPLRAPSGVTITSGDEQVSLSWNSVTGATSYNIYYGTAAGVFPAGTKISGATSGDAVTGLTNGETYYFVVTAVNAGGESTASSEMSATLQIPAPGIPSGVSITGGDAQVTLSWTAVTGATSYNIYRGETAGDIPADLKYSDVTSGDPITGLTNGVTYYFVVTAVNAGGEGSVSSTVSATPQFPLGMTYPNTGFATNITDALATLNGSFINPSANPSYETDAWFQWGETAAYGNDTYRLVYGYPGSIRPSINIDPPLVGTVYHYRFCTENVDGQWCGGDKLFATIPMAVKTTLASALTYPVQFAVDATNIYWTEGGADGTVKKAPLIGGAVTTLASTLNDPFGITVDATNVYWAEQGGGNVKMVPIAGGGITTLASTLENPQYIAVDNNNVYFTEYGSWNVAAGLRNADGTVSLVPVSGGAIVQLATGLNGPQTIKVDGTNIYWTELANYIGGAGAIKQVPVVGGTITTLVSELSNSRNIAVDATSVYYWSGYGTMSKVPIGGATGADPIVEITSGMTGTQPLEVDSTSVYWTEDSYGGTVKELNKANGNVSVITSGLSDPQGIALDASSIYWMEADVFDSGTSAWTNVGAILRILK